MEQEKRKKEEIHIFFKTEIDEDMIVLMKDLHEEVERVVEIANEKWDLGLHYE